VLSRRCVLELSPSPKHILAVELHGGEVAICKGWILGIESEGRLFYRPGAGEISEGEVEH
jgi:hypothetical protein